MAIPMWGVGFRIVKVLEACGRSTRMIETGCGVLRLGGKSLEEMYSSLNFGVKVWAFDRFGPP
ncbi:hypothetical protein Tco_0470144, partial [Tanacetum coccineum]